MSPSRGLLERLEQGPVVCAEGYLFECERRGYLQAGAFVPEVVLEHPELVAGLHREFVHAGSDVVEAFTYYGHREKLRLIGKEHLLEPLNRGALEIAARGGARVRRAARRQPLQHERLRRPTTTRAARSARCSRSRRRGPPRRGADLLIGETFSWLEEALIALEAMRATGLPTVVTLDHPPRARHARGARRPRRPAARWRRPAPTSSASTARAAPTRCCRCSSRSAPRSAATSRRCPCPTARPTSSRSMQSLRDPRGGDVRPFPTGLDPFTCTRYELGDFARARRTSSACATSASAAAPARTTSAPWPRRSGARRRRAASRPTCPSTPTGAPTRASRSRTGATRSGCDGRLRVAERRRQLRARRRDRAAPAASRRGPSRKRGPDTLSAADDAPAEVADRARRRRRGRPRTPPRRPRSRSSRARSSRRHSSAARPRRVRPEPHEPGHGEQRVERRAVVVEQQRAARRRAGDRDRPPAVARRADRARRRLAEQREHLGAVEHGEVRGLAELGDEAAQQPAAPARAAAGRPPARRARTPASRCR